MPKSAKVWFITGTSKDFGRIGAEAALGRGEKVLATAPPLEAERYCLARRVQCPCPRRERRGRRGLPAVKEGHAQFGRPDVVVENADHGLR